MRDRIALLPFAALPTCYFARLGFRVILPVTGSVGN